MEKSSGVFKDTPLRSSRTKMNSGLPDSKGPVLITTPCSCPAGLSERLLWSNTTPGTPGVAEMRKELFLASRYSQPCC